MLKYISAAEVSKLPATVLAYFIDSRQTAKLPPDVRKEIMIAMGELSTKDHAAIPAKTREEIILQGLAAIVSLFYLLINRRKKVMHIEFHSIRTN